MVSWASGSLCSGTNPLGARPPHGLYIAYNFIAAAFSGAPGPEIPTDYQEMVMSGTLDMPRRMAAVEQCLAQFGWLEGRNLESILRITARHRKLAAQCS